MGLTIHYRIEANPNWTRRQIREKLENTRRFALTLPVASVGEVVEFRGKDCDWQQQEDETPDEADARDPFRWAKIQASRDVESPWRPGCSRGQFPSHMLCCSVWPAEGCEQMNIGWCSYPRFVWKPDEADSECSAGWSQVLAEPSRHRESMKLLRAFMKKYRLVKIPDKLVQNRRWSQYSRETIRHFDHAYASVAVWATYLSHRRGYGPGHIELSLPDYRCRQLGFRFRGTVEEGRRLFASAVFESDLKDMLYGQEYIVPAQHGDWSSFCKTQYGNDPRYGGWNNFQRAHLSVCAILEYLQTIGFRVDVSDEGGFWEKRDLAALAKEIGEWDAMIAGLAGIIKDVAEAQGEGFESSMSGRPDFERLEVRATKIESIAVHLTKLREQLLPSPQEETPCR